LEVGEEVILGLEETTNQSLLTGQGKVVWCFRATKRAYAVGVRFEEHLGSDDIQRITIPTARLDY
jgi:Tfp pilus assembly protein PilZ